MIRRPEAKAPLETRRVTRFPAEGLLDSPPDSIRTRLWRLSTDESDWDEVLAVWRAVASKHQEINDCKRDIYALQDRLESLQREKDDLTWPARLSDRPNNWRSLSSSKRNRLLQQHRRSTAWILLHSPNELGVEIQRQFWGSRDSELRRDPTMLRLCLKKSTPHSWLAPLEPEPAILQERELVIEIMCQCPAFLLHRNIPQEFFSERDLFKAAVVGSFQTIPEDADTDTDVLCQFPNLCGMTRI